MKLTEFSRTCRQLNFLKKMKNINLILISFLSLYLIFYTSCEEEIPGVMNSESFTKFDSLQAKDGGLEWRNEAPDIAQDNLLYFGEDNFVKNYALTKYDLSEANLDTLNTDDILGANILINTHDQLWQGEDDSLAANMILSLLDNSVIWSEKDYKDLNIINTDTTGLIKYTIPDTMTSSANFKVDLPVGKLADVITGKQEFNLLINGEYYSEKGPIQTIYSSEYNSDYLQIEVEYRNSRGDTIERTIETTDDISITEYKSRMELITNEMVITEGLESFIVLPVEIERNYSSDVIVVDATLQIEAEEVIDYNAGIPLAITDVDSNFVLAEVDSSNRNISYAYSDMDSSLSFDVKAFLQNAIRDDKKEFNFVIWCEDNAPNIAQFYLKNKNYTLEILTLEQANQEN